MSGPEPQQTYAAYEEAFAEVAAPFALVDLDAIAENGREMLGRAHGKPVRIASKSVRCRSMLERILALDPGFQGLMTFTLPETLWLAEQRFGNLLLAYPSADAAALQRLARLDVEGAPIVMVDSVAHLDLIRSAIGGGGGRVRVCIDLDAGWWPLGGRVKIGPKRSPVHTPKQAEALAREIAARPGAGVGGADGLRGAHRRRR